jgi:tetratricopeptide (TPR) repeat protein
MLFWNIGVLAVVGTGVWFLTGIDKTAGGESKRSHYFTRSLRCLAVVFLVAVFLWFVQGGGGVGGVALLLIIPVSIALVLRSSLAEVFSQGFLRFVDPSFHDDRELDLKRDGRYLDTIAHLIHSGRKDDAIRLCEELKKSGDINPATLDMTLEFLGVKSSSLTAQSPLNLAVTLRETGDFSGAEAMLKPLLAKNPADSQVALLLMRVYAQDLRQPDMARMVLMALEKQPHVPPAHLEFARRSIDEWSRSAPMEAAPTATERPRSLEELLQDKAYGSAVTMLEQNIAEQPREFELRMKLAEIHALCCHNLPRAEKIIGQMESAGSFSPEQIASGKAKLKEWREIAGQRK